MSDGKRTLLIVLGVVFLLSASIFLAIRFYIVLDKEQQQLDAAQSLVEQVRPYYEEIDLLKNELAVLKKNSVYRSQATRLMVGFVVSDASDIAYIREKAAVYSLSPILVIDCSAELAEIKAWIADCDTTWEIMLYATPLSEQNKAALTEVQAYLKSAGRPDCGVFYLRDDDCNAENLTFLTDAGFIGYTTYHDFPTCGQALDGAIYFDYSYVKSDDNAAVDARLASCYQSKAPSVFSFEMKLIRSGVLSESTVNRTLEKLIQYTKLSDCEFSTIEKICEELSQINELNAAYQVEYEQQAAPIYTRIAELESIINRIYTERITE